MRSLKSFETLTVRLISFSNQKIRSNLAQRADRAKMVRKTATPCGYRVLVDDMRNANSTLGEPVRPIRLERKVRTYAELVDLVSALVAEDPSLPEAAILCKPTSVKEFTEQMFIDHQRERSDL